MDTAVLGLLLIVDLLLLWQWLKRKLNRSDSGHSYNLYVYANNGDFKRAEGIPDVFSALESAEEHFARGAQRIVLSEYGQVKRLFTRQDYETGLCVW